MFRDIKPQFAIIVNSATEKARAIGSWSNFHRSTHTLKKNRSDRSNHSHPAAKL